MIHYNTLAIIFLAHCSRYAISIIVQIILQKNFFFYEIYLCFSPLKNGIIAHSNLNLLNQGMLLINYGFQHNYSFQLDAVFIVNLLCIRITENVSELEYKY